MKVKNQSRKHYEWFLKSKFPKRYFKPRMSSAELVFFNRIIRASSVILEYGSGGSTIALINLKKTIYSVDSNRNFYCFMLSIYMVRRYLKRKLKYIFIDIGITDMWGRPLTDCMHQNWSNYYTRIWDIVEKDSAIIDLILVDGRFRVACTLYAIKKMLARGWETRFLIHDFEREHYHIVLNFLDIIDYRETLYYFKLKEGINLNDVETYLSKYRDNYE